MPQTVWSTAIAEAYAFAPSDVVILHTLELSHIAFADGPIRVVLNTEDIQARIEATAQLNANQVVTFLRCRFDFTLPPITEDAAPEIVIAIDNVDRRILKNVELAVDQSDPITVIYRPYLSNDLLAGPHMNPPLKMEIRTIEGNQFRVTARATIGDISNRVFPSTEYTGTRFPGLAR